MWALVAGTQSGVSVGVRGGGSFARCGPVPRLGVRVRRGRRPVPPAACDCCSDALAGAGGADVTTVGLGEDPDVRGRQDQCCQQPSPLKGLHPDSAPSQAAMVSFEAGVEGFDVIAPTVILGPFRGAIEMVLSFPQKIIGTKSDGARAVAFPTRAVRRGSRRGIQSH